MSRNQLQQQKKQPEHGFDHWFFVKCPLETQFSLTLAAAGFICVGLSYIWNYLFPADPTWVWVATGQRRMGFLQIFAAPVVYFFVSHWAAEDRRLSTVPVVEEEIRKKKRTQKEFQDELARQASNRLLTYYLRFRIYRSDMRLIELQTKLTKLAHAHVPDPNIPPDLLHLDDHELTGMKTTRDLVSNLKPPSGPEQAAKLPRPTIQEQIDLQKAHIRQLEKDRDEELAGILKGRKYQQLSSNEQDVYNQAELSWEEKIEAEREKMRTLMQRRPVVK